VGAIQIPVSQPRHERHLNACHDVPWSDRGTKKAKLKKCSENIQQRALTVKGKKRAPMSSNPSITQEIVGSFSSRGMKSREKRDPQCQVGTAHNQWILRTQDSASSFLPHWGLSFYWAK
jgi:hypothetical protein